MATTKSRLNKFGKTILRYSKYSRRKTPVFVVGCQRSGTTMILKVLRSSPKIHVYHEGDGVVMEARYYRLISDDALRRAIVKTPEPIVIFKPLNDTQYVDRLLGRHPGAKVIWVYRNYLDVVSSALKRFKNAHKEIIYEIIENQFSHPGREAFGERVSAHVRKIIKHFENKNLSSQDGSALIWYLRNEIYFDLNLKDRSEVFICKYENLVIEPKKYFRHLFNFIGADFSDAYVKHTHSKSVNKNDVDQIDPEISTLCEKMLERLDNEHTRQFGLMESA